MQHATIRVFTSVLYSNLQYTTLLQASVRVNLIMNQAFGSLVIIEALLLLQSLTMSTLVSCYGQQVSKVVRLCVNLFSSFQEVTYLHQHTWCTQSAQSSHCTELGNDEISFILIWLAVYSIR